MGVALGSVVFGSYIFMSAKENKAQLEMLGPEERKEAEAALAKARQQFRVRAGLGGVGVVALVALWQFENPLWTWAVGGPAEFHLRQAERLAAVPLTFSFISTKFRDCFRDCLVMGAKDPPKNA